MFTNERDAAPPEVLRLSDRAELIEAVPYLLGFRPTRSAVLIGLSEDNAAARVVLTARIDIKDAFDAGCIEQVGQAMHRNSVTTVIAVCFLDALDADPAVEPDIDGQLTDIADQLQAAGFVVGDVLAVGPQHWWSIHGGWSGRRIGGSAEAIGAGLPAPESTRTGLLTALTSPVEVPPTLQVDLDVAKSSPKAEPGELFAYATAMPAGGGSVPMSSLQLARFAVALTDVAIRDAIWLALDANHEHDAQLAAIALEIGTRCPGRYAAAGLFLFAWSRWRAGDGVLAAEAAQRAVTAAGGEYVAAELLLHALSMGLNPVTTPRLEHGGGGADEREL